MSDFETIQAVLKGNSDAYGGLVRTYQARVRGVCLSFLLNREEADDAAQDVFVKAFASLRQYRRQVSFGAWLHRIAANYCLDLLRKKKRQKTDSLDALVEHSGEQAGEEWLSTVDIPIGETEDQQKMRLATRVLGLLSPEQRQILILRELEGLSYEEIGQALECSLDAVKARLRRARFQLQEKARHFLEGHSLNK